jgi:hypothetical protein
MRCNVGIIEVGSLSLRKLDLRNSCPFPLGCGIGTRLVDLGSGELLIVTLSQCCGWDDGIGIYLIDIWSCLLDIRTCVGIVVRLDVGLRIVSGC